MHNSSFLTHLFRSAFRNPGLTGINMAGLAIGLAITMFLLVYLQFEFSYDKHFKDSDRIYRSLVVLGEGEAMPLGFAELGHRLEEEVPEVEVASRLYDAGNMLLYSEQENKLNAACFYVDNSFLRIFDFKPVYGLLEGALDSWEYCVITRTTAERFFGEGVNPVGKMLNQEGSKAYQIRAVIEDIPANTHFKFDILTRLPDFGWYGLEYFTYLKFKPGIDQEQAVIKCNSVNKKMLEEKFGDFLDMEFDAMTEPLLSIHTSTKSAFDLTPTANKSNLIFIIIVVCLVLGIVISNFISLSVIQGEQQAREICIRKTNGAGRGQIMSMLFRNAFFITFCAFLLAVILHYFFSSVLANWLNFHFPEGVGVSLKMWLEFLGLYVMLAFIVGCYPAWYLSKYNPVELVQKSENRKFRLTAASVALQFTVVIFCISSLFFVWRQLDYVRNLPLGFQKDHIMEVSISIRNQDFPGLKSELLSYPSIKEVAIGQGNPIDGCSGNIIRRIDQPQEKGIEVDERRAGAGYLSLYEIPLLEGEDFKEYANRENQDLIVSETLAAVLELKNPVGQKVYFFGEQPWTIVGVVKDVITSAHQKMSGRVYSAYADNFFTLAVKYEPGKYQEVKAYLLKVLNEHYKDIPVYIRLTSDRVEDQYWQDRVTARILMSGSVLAVLLALLGLFALSGFVTVQKRREIGVRRVLGARIDEIIYYLHRYIIIRILPAIPVGVILSYFIMNRWLENFEYARPLEWWVFLASILLTILIAMTTVFWQTFRAATANPVDAIKSEA